MERTMEKLLEAGKIVNTHGIRGEVRIQPWVDSAEFLKTFKKLYIDGKPLRLRQGRVHKSFLIASFEGVEDVNAAMLLKNKTVYIDRTEAKLPKGSFFLADIMGARVVTEEGQELGLLEDIIEAPAANVYVVRGQREILIPAVPQFIIKTDPKGKLITVRLIEGM